jgi:hypothetical protein
MQFSRKYFYLFVLSSFFGLTCSQAAQADPFQLEVQEKQFMGQPQQAYPAYPSYPQLSPMQGEAAYNKPSVLSTGISKVLPPDFLGRWNVRGQRQKVQAMPEFQASAEQAFAGNTNNVWTIAGSPQSGYSLSADSGISTQFVVDKVEGNTAYIRYQHPIGKTMAQEAVVLSLSPGGLQFNGLERISIVKEGLAQPRAQVTYQLVGNRQR